MDAYYPSTSQLEEKMNKLIQKLTLSAGSINRRHIQIFLTLLILSLLVLGAGAPGMDGGAGGV
jgi:hypothetical protein